MRGIILAGGLGTRLYPATSLVSKQLLDVGGKPMIYYPLTNLILAGIREVLVISTPDHLPQFEKLLGTGEQWGMRFSYIVQPEPKGLSQAFLLGEEFIREEPVTLILGDNIFYGAVEYLYDIRGLTRGALIYAKHVRDPQRFGVVAFDENGNPTSIEEKPAKPKSHYAVTGLYAYGGDVTARARSLKPSARGELEITDLNRLYLEDGSLRVHRLRRGIGWYDTGTKEAIEQVRHLILLKEQTQEQLVGSPEEAAYRMGFFGRDHLARLIRQMPAGNEYRRLLELMAEEEGCVLG